MWTKQNRVVHRSAHNTCLALGSRAKAYGTASMSGASSAPQQAGRTQSGTVPKQAGPKQSGPPPWRSVPPPAVHPNPQVLDPHVVEMVRATCEDLDYIYWARIDKGDNELEAFERVRRHVLTLGLKACKNDRDQPSFLTMEVWMRWAEQDRVTSLQTLSRPPFWPNVPVTYEGEDGADAFGEPEHGMTTVPNLHLGGRRVELVQSPDFFARILERGRKAHEDRREAEATTHSDAATSHRTKRQRAD